VALGLVGAVDGLGGEADDDDGGVGLGGVGGRRRDGTARALVALVGAVRRGGVGNVGADALHGRHEERRRAVVVALHVGGGGGVAAGERDGLDGIGAEREGAALVLEQHDRLVRRLQRELLVRGRVDDLRAERSVRIRLHGVEEPQAHLRREEVRERVVDERHVDLLLVHQRLHDLGRHEAAAVGVHARGEYGLDGLLGAVGVVVVVLHVGDGAAAAKGLRGCG
jgi:hypothetical protein